MAFIYISAVGMCIAFAVIIGLVIYLLGVHDERRENHRIRKGGYRNTGFSAFANARNERVNRDSEGLDEIEHRVES